MSPDGSQAVPPEEKLLRLIRGKPQTVLPPGATIRAPSAQGWRLPSWWVSALNVLLGSVVMGELIALLAVVIQPVPTRDSAQALARSLGPELVESSADSKAQPPTTQQDLTPTLAASVSRPLFHTRDGAGTPSPSSGIPSAGASALVSRLSLLGIMAGEKPQAIVEDTQTKKTYFVTVGQHVIEGLVVEAVQDNRVVFTVNGERVELSL
jgi:hypothetical protein